jgi:hypothetical protein
MPVMLGILHASHPYVPLRILPRPQHVSLPVACISLPLLSLPPLPLPLLALKCPGTLPLPLTFSGALPLQEQFALDLLQAALHTRLDDALLGVNGGL